MNSLQNNGFGRVTLEFKVPSRGMIGFRSEFLTDTKGLGILNSLFDSYAPWFGPIPQRNSGTIIADRPGKVTQYASQGMVDRGELFVDVNTEVYKGMIVGERNKVGDLDVSMSNDDPVAGIQVQFIDIPDFLDVEDLVATDRLDGLELSWSMQTDGSTIMVAFSLTGQQLQPGDGPIAYINYQSNNI